jgi:hypothetical protein
VEYYLKLLPPLLCSGVLSQTADTTVMQWSTISNCCHHCYAVEYYLKLLTPLLCSGVLSQTAVTTDMSGVLSQTADTTVTLWSVTLPQRLSLAARLRMAIWAASTTLETYTLLTGQYGLGVLQGGGSGPWSKLISY